MKNPISKNIIDYLFLSAPFLLAISCIFIFDQIYTGIAIIMLSLFIYIISTYIKK